jgi:hypothetical protein
MRKRASEERYCAWVQIPVRPDAEGRVIVDARTVAALGPIRDVEFRSLEAALPDRPTIRVKTAEGGVLEGLRIASQRVAEQTRCAPGDATTFILCGEPLPYYSALKSLIVVGDVDADGVGNPWLELSSLNRIQLTLDPILSPREVTEIYRGMRRAVFGRGKTRYRAMSEKHIRLALFSLKRPGEETIKAARDAWNKQYPKWRYRQETNFGRDRNVAKKRALATLGASPTSGDAVESWLLGGSPKPQLERARRQ